MLDVPAVRSYIDTHRTRRQSNKVLHGHPSPVFWLDRDVAISDAMRHREHVTGTVRKRLNLYVGTPYCLPTDPDRCGFCLFPSEIYQDRSQLDVYLEYLKREGDLFRPHLADTELASIYFGGGTSNLYKADQYAVLMGIVGDVFEIPRDIEVTLEGIPQTFSHEKLAAMKACGINRISMGVQQLDDELIKLSGRKQKAEQVYRTIESCHTLGLNMSVDLIFGWPNQTTDHMLRDLQAVVDTGITHITHYELNVAGRTDFSRHRRAELPSTTENVEMYRLGKALLEAHGYRQVTAVRLSADHRRTGPAAICTKKYSGARFEMKTDSLSASTRGGGGTPVSRSSLAPPQDPGWAYLNQVQISDYYRDLDAGRYPVMRGFRYTKQDLRIHLLFQELQGLSVDRPAHHAMFERDVVDDFRTVWQVLEERGWVRVTDTRIDIIGDGVFYLPLIQNLLAHDRTKQMRKMKRARSRSVAAIDPAGDLVAHGPQPAEDDAARLIHPSPATSVI